MPEYIHYGHKIFDKTLFNPIQNELIRTKPEGGLWASSVNAKFGWKDWCQREDFRECNEENSFKFTLTDIANVLHIKSKNDLINLPRIPYDVLGSCIFLDFEKIKAYGYDAVAVYISIDYQLHSDLFGWDCDSLLVMNPDVIQPSTKDSVRCLLKHKPDGIEKGIENALP